MPRGTFWDWVKMPKNMVLQLQDAVANGDSKVVAVANGDAVANGRHQR